MFRKVILVGLSISLVMSAVSCRKKGVKKEAASPVKEYSVKLITLDPGHFHAALVQKTMYDEVSPTVYVYAPKGPDVEDH
ncbi:unnamed protein product, partial [marine sediment metagenome]